MNFARPTLQFDKGLLLLWKSYRVLEVTKGLIAAGWGSQLKPIQLSAMFRNSMSDDLVRPIKPHPVSVITIFIRNREHDVQNTAMY